MIRDAERTLLEANYNTMLRFDDICDHVLNLFEQSFISSKNFSNEMILNKKENIATFSIQHQNNFIPKSIARSI